MTRLRHMLSWSTFIMVLLLGAIVALTPLAKEGYDNRVINNYMKLVQTSCNQIIPPINERELEN
jgi:hypothetical protein